MLSSKVKIMWENPFFTHENTQKNAKKLDFTKHFLHI